MPPARELREGERIGVDGVLPPLQLPQRRRHEVGGVLVPLVAEAGRNLQRLAVAPVEVVRPGGVDGAFLRAVRGGEAGREAAEELRRLPVPPLAVAHHAREEEGLRREVGVVAQGEIEVDGLGLAAVAHVL